MYVDPLAGFATIRCSTHRFVSSSQPSSSAAAFVSYEEKYGWKSMPSGFPVTTIPAAFACSIAQRGAVPCWKTALIFGLIASRSPLGVYFGSALRSFSVYPAAFEMKSMFLLGPRVNGGACAPPLLTWLSGHTAPDRVRLFTLDLQRCFGLPLTIDRVFVVVLGVHDEPRRAQRRILNVLQVGEEGVAAELGVSGREAAELALHEHRHLRSEGTGDNPV